MCRTSLFRTDAPTVLTLLVVSMIGLLPNSHRRLLFKDVDNIPIGVAFPRHIEAALSTAKVILVIIGKEWLKTVDEHSSPRLQDPSDFVRVEIQTALRIGIPVLPLTVSHAVMPAVQDLPVGIHELSSRHALAVRPDPDFHHDMDRLVLRLRALLGPQKPSIVPRPVSPVQTVWQSIVDFLQDSFVLSWCLLGRPQNRWRLRKLPNPFIYLGVCLFVGATLTIAALPRVMPAYDTLAASPTLSAPQKAFWAFFHPVAAQMVSRVENGMTFSLFATIVWLALSLGLCSLFAQLFVFFKPGFNRQVGWQKLVFMYYLGLREVLVGCAMIVLAGCMVFVSQTSAQTFVKTVLPGVFRRPRIARIQVGFCNCGLQARR